MIQIELDIWFGGKKQEELRETVFQYSTASSGQLTLSRLEAGSEVVAAMLLIMYFIWGM